MRGEMVEQRLSALRKKPCRVCLVGQVGSGGHGNRQGRAGINGQDRCRCFRRPPRRRLSADQLREKVVQRDKLLDRLFPEMLCMETSNRLDADKLHRLDKLKIKSPDANEAARPANEVDASGPRVPAVAPGACEAWNAEPAAHWRGNCAVCLELLPFGDGALRFYEFAGFA
ncbi:hypothetical protein M885DRAFT_620123 [Pelagophyceae sp. CCMP2097]|nr:hypothetical protein M885DRAFT_620123 [Pelagophyceae sp. CCMP2097]